MDDRVAKLWAEYEPRIQAAKAADNRDRHRFFSNLLEETIGDFPAVILTHARYLLVSLDGIFEDAEDDPRIPVLRFLWIVSPEFAPDPEKAMEFIRKNRKFDPTPYPMHIQKYMDDAFAYAPPQKAANSSGQVTPKEWVSSIVDTIASEYGWAERDVLTLPLPRLFLYLRRIRVRLGLDSVDFSSEADRLQAEFMRRANERN